MLPTHRLAANLLPNPRNLLVAILLAYSLPSLANDSTGYIGTGGVQYLKNDAISMQSEDLYIAKDKVRVDYQFANLSDKDITETVLFPLPALSAPRDSDYADAGALIDNFKLWVDNKRVYPDLNVRVFIPSVTLLEGEVTHTAKNMVDATNLFKACAVTDKELMGYWHSDNNINAINKKLLTCDHIALKKLQQKIAFDPTDKYASTYIYWEAQPIYSWQQTFKAHATTFVRHAYQPPVGGSAYFGHDEYQTFCADDTFSQAQKNELHTHSAIKYILTTGANWATPIQDFSLTVDRDPDELTTFCWKGSGKINKIGPTTFRVTETNFVPSHDLHIAFAR